MHWLFQSAAEKQFQGIFILVSEGFARKALLNTENEKAETLEHWKLFLFHLEMKEVSSIENQAQDMHIQTREVKED